MLYTKENAQRDNYSLCAAVILCVRAVYGALYDAVPRMLHIANSQLSTPSGGI